VSYFAPRFDDYFFNIRFNFLPFDSHASLQVISLRRVLVLLHYAQQLVSYWHILTALSHEQNSWSATGTYWRHQHTNRTADQLLAHTDGINTRTEQLVIAQMLTEWGKEEQLCTDCCTSEERNGTVLLKAGTVNPLPTRGMHSSKSVKPRWTNLILHGSGY
jgi:hypothetical protein